MGRPPPPEEGCRLAAKLRAQGYGLVATAEHLRAAGYQCASPNTASRWADIGFAEEKLLRIVEEASDDNTDDKIEFTGLDRDRTRVLIAAAVDQAMGTLADALTTAKNNPQVLDMALRHLKWLLHMKAQLVNAYAPPHPRPLDLGDDNDPANVPDWLKVMISKTVEREQQHVDDYRNGGRA